MVESFKKSAETVKNIFIEAIKLLNQESWDDIIAINKVILVIPLLLIISPKGKSLF